MKKITNKNKNSVKSSKYYGFVTSLDDVGFITREMFEGGDYITRAGAGLTKGNSFGHREPILFDLINFLVNSGDGENFVIYEFNSPFEMFKWMGGNPKI